MVAGGALVGVVVAGVCATAYAAGSGLVPPGFEGEHLERSLAASAVLAAAGSLIAAAVLARGLRLRHPWPFAASGLLLTMIVAFCGYGIARAAHGVAGGAFFLAGAAAVYAGLAACTGRR
jgi:hypothetical protein